MSPEQAQGEEVDPRSDLFSLGCLLYRCCTGRLPFEGKDALSTLVAVKSENPRPPGEPSPSTTGSYSRNTSNRGLAALGPTAST